MTMKTNFPRKIRIIITLVLVSSTLVVSWAVGRRTVEEKAPSSDVVQGVSPARMDGWKPTSLNGWTELCNVLKSMRGSFPLHATGHIDLVNNENDRRIERQFFTLDCADSIRGRYLIASQEMISDGGLFLAVDREQKVVLVQQSAPAMQKLSPFEQLRVLLERQRDSLQVMVNANGEHMLCSPGFVRGDMSMLQLYYAPGDYKVRKVVMYQMNMGERQDITATKDQPQAAEAYYVNRMEFIYDDIQKGQMPEGHYYDTYIRWNGTTAALTESARDYRLINTLQPKSSK